MLYFSVSSDIMLLSNMWTGFGLHNCAKGKVVDFVYTDSEVPKNCGIPEAVVVQFWCFPKSTDIEPFIEGYERSGNMLP